MSPSIASHLSTEGGVSYINPELDNLTNVVSQLALRFPVSISCALGLHVSHHDYLALTWVLGIQTVTRTLSSLAIYPRATSKGPSAFIFISTRIKFCMKCLYNFSKTNTWKMWIKTLKYCKKKVTILFQWLYFSKKHIGCDLF